ncbi:response regulator transcription factor [Paenibacillus segetis]|uniref:AraC family transcriptional regulator n=1 Tax=Paenibacillus segetis TaxID=1325360 RepID=A0ABQ1Y5L2_9BACL|nr:helix-turn-helix domain-containing protein [Paenibacillus segetis]GGH12453.1 AraC family transcriptional regulator [Paenibacillus segetis]
MKALIVDDEARVRKAVRLLVDWTTHGIDEIIEASGGNEAIEIIRQSKPALVIMDMMMDLGHGMELISWVSEFSGTTKFIVVSGHNDFEFVRQTLRHGGIDYILKPIEPDAINTAVANAVAAWRNEEQERKDQQLQNIRINEFRPIYGEKLLSALIDDPVTAEASLRRLRIEGVIPDKAGICQLLLLQIDISDSPLLTRFGGDIELLQYSIINICNEFLQPSRLGVAFHYWNAPEIAVLLWDLHESPIEIVRKINEGIFHTLQRRMHFGISHPGVLPTSLPIQYKDAAEALRRRNLLHPEEYHHFTTKEPGTIPGSQTYFSIVKEDWKMAIMSGQSEALATTAQRWINELSKGGVITPEMLYTWKDDALLFRSQLLRETLGGDAEQALAELERADLEHPAPHANGYSFSLFAWRDWSFELMQRIMLKISACQVKEKNTMNNIVKYIEQRYQDDLSLQEIAGKFFVSREYISRKFKQEFGINFSDYIGKYRIDKAKLLMQNPHLKLSQISEMVGFHDVKYFSKVFKKQEGVSPKTYRSKLIP